MFFGTPLHCGGPLLFVRPDRPLRLEADVHRSSLPAATLSHDVTHPWLLRCPRTRATTPLPSPPARRSSRVPLLAAGLGFGEAAIEDAAAERWRHPVRPGLPLSQAHWPRSA